MRISDWSSDVRSSDLLGRQTLLDPVEWTDNGWFRMRGGDLSQPLAKPAGGTAGPHGMALSDDFATLALGAKWHFFRPAAAERVRARVADRSEARRVGQACGSTCRCRWAAYH